ncbi:hypothetical protein [Nonomuraea maritima]|nr:hypothetical protein [Nonomuraea maritima]
MAHPPQPPQPYPHPQQPGDSGGQGAAPGYGPPQPGPEGPAYGPPPGAPYGPGPYQQAQYGPGPQQQGPYGRPDGQDAYQQPGAHQQPGPYQPGPHQQPGPYQPGPYQQPGPGPHPQAGGPHGGFQPPGGPPYGGPPGGYPGPPPKNNNGLVLGLVIAGVAVLLLAGVGVGAYTYLRNKPDVVPTIALPTVTTLPDTDPPTPPPTSEPPEPSPTPSESATDDRPEPGSPINDDEFDDWNFRLDSTKYNAKKVGGWTYDSCDPIDPTGLLDCDRSTEIAYTAYSGHLKAILITASFPNERSAQAAAKRLDKAKGQGIKWREDKTLTNPVYAKMLSGPTGKYVVITIVTADSSARASAQGFHRMLQSDHAAYYVFRDM